MRKLLKMTLIVDSSFCPETGAAGWGLWCKRDDWRQGATAAGSILRQMKDSAEAELAGIVEAVRFLQSQSTLDGIQIVTLQCDNIETLLILAQCPNVRCAKSVDIRDLDVRQTQHIRQANKMSYALRFETLRADFVKMTHRVQVWVRHVKGHKGKVTGRHSVNELCDRLAKTQMRAMRKALTCG